MKLNQISWNHLLAKSKAGDIEAQNEAVMWFENGYCDSNFEIEINIEQAAYWYLESAQSGNSDSQDAISRLYSLGQGIEQNIDEAIKWALKAIEQGNAIAASNLATIYRDEMNFQKAFEYHSLALEMGNKSALLQLGLCHYLGLGTSVNYQKSYTLFEELAKEENANEAENDEANYWIGLSYLNGNGQIKSVDLAREYLMKANIDEDHEAAQLILNVIGRVKKN